MHFFDRANIIIVRQNELKLCFVTKVSVTFITNECGTYASEEGTCASGVDTCTSGDGLVLVPQQEALVLQKEASKILSQK